MKRYEFASKKPGEVAIKKPEVVKRVSKKESSESSSSSSSSSSRSSSEVVKKEPSVK